MGKSLRKYARERSLGHPEPHGGPPVRSVDQGGESIGSRRSRGGGTLHERLSSVFFFFFVGVGMGTSGCELLSKRALLLGKLPRLASICAHEKK